VDAGPVGIDSARSEVPQSTGSTIQMPFTGGIQGIGMVLDPEPGIGFIHPIGTGPTGEQCDVALGIDAADREMKVGPFHQDDEAGIGIGGERWGKCAGREGKFDGTELGKGTGGLEETGVGGPGALGALAIDEELVEVPMAAGNGGEGGLPEVGLAGNRRPVGDAASAGDLGAGPAGGADDDGVGVVGGENERFGDFVASAGKADGDEGIGFGEVMLPGLGDGSAQGGEGALPAGGVRTGAGTGP